MPPPCCGFGPCPVWFLQLLLSRLCLSVRPPLRVSLVFSGLVGCLVALRVGFWAVPWGVFPNLSCFRSSVQIKPVPRGFHSSRRALQ